MTRISICRLILCAIAATAGGGAALAEPAPHPDLRPGAAHFSPPAMPFVPGKHADDDRNDPRHGSGDRDDLGRIVDPGHCDDDHRPATPE